MFLVVSALCADLLILIKNGTLVITTSNAISVERGLNENTFQEIINTRSAGGVFDRQQVFH